MVRSCKVEFLVVECCNIENFRSLFNWTNCVGVVSCGLSSRMTGHKGVWRLFGW